MPGQETENREEAGQEGEKLNHLELGCAENPRASKNVQIKNTLSTQGDISNVPIIFLDRFEEFHQYSTKSDGENVETRRVLMFRFSRAFTLIELLIVVAIIAILAAIAVPNFLEAQVRSKVSRVKSDMRSMATALEAYRVDNPKYPPNWNSVAAGAAKWVHTPGNNYGMWFAQWALIPITTPISYLTSIPGTAFNTVGSAHDSAMNKYDGKNHGPEWSTSDYIGTIGFPYCITPEVGWTTERKWRLRDVGPDLWANNQTKSTMPYYQVLYDPTNGTVSSGDIIRWGP